MNNQEIKKESPTELRKSLAEKRELLRVMRFKVAQRQLKKVHEIKNNRRAIARLATALHQAQKDQSTDK
ncbi:MAG TPA: 50S ribosomal protein L29 [Candidatus Paceibacterota bacterium]|nr:50S ribosomal protein L29 [Candidatus Paceibacterota bacterium]